MSWAVERHRESAAAFHARALPGEWRRAVWIADPTGPALVLGSTQPDEVADPSACAAAGVEVVRRRSGGGAVLVAPGELVWVDVLVPAGDPLWRWDVGRAVHWLGEVWAAALGSLGDEALVHRGSLVHGPWSRLVCFGGVGPGEVVNAAGAKLVGISQRRTREGARFQCAALTRWDPGGLVALLALAPDRRAEAVAQLAPLAVASRAGPEALLEAFLHHLP